jgi:hypothetical protein
MYWWMLNVLLNEAIRPWIRRLPKWKRINPWSVPHLMVHRNQNSAAETSTRTIQTRSVPPEWEEIAFFPHNWDCKMISKLLARCVLSRKNLTRFQSWGERALFVSALWAPLRAASEIAQTVKTWARARAKTSWAEAQWLQRHLAVNI